jgi:SEL1 protein
LDSTAEHGQPELTVPYLNQAIQHGNPFEAFYELAKVHAHKAALEGASAAKSSGTCGASVSFFKVAAERGCWQYDVVGEGDRAWQAGDRTNALLKWWMAAEMGYEVALNDVAFVLDKGERR